MKRWELELLSFLGNWEDIIFNLKMRVFELGWFDWLGIEGVTWGFGELLAFGHNLLAKNQIFSKKNEKKFFGEIFWSFSKRNKCHSKPCPQRLFQPWFTPLTPKNFLKKSHDRPKNTYPNFFKVAPFPANNMTSINHLSTYKKISFSWFTDLSSSTQKRT